MYRDRSGRFANRFSDNNLTNLFAGTFSHLKKLTELSLFGNQLKNLEKGPFDGLNNLTRLDLGNNKLPEVIILLRDLHPGFFFTCIFCRDPGIIICIVGLNI